MLLFTILTFWNVSYQHISWMSPATWQIYWVNKHSEHYAQETEIDWKCVIGWGSGRRWMGWVQSRIRAVSLVQIWGCFCHVKSPNFLLLVVLYIMDIKAMFSLWKVPRKKKISTENDFLIFGLPRKIQNQN